MIRERQKNIEKKRAESAVLGSRMGGLTSEENYGRCAEQAQRRQSVMAGLKRSVVQFQSFDTRRLA